MNKNEAKEIVSNLEWKNGNIPYDGEYSNNDHDFRWYKVNELAELEALCVVFNVNLLTYQMQRINYPEWICVEAYDGHVDFDEPDTDIEIRFTTLSVCKKAFENLLVSLEEEFLQSKFETLEREGLLLYPKVACEQLVYMQSDYWGIIPYKVCGIQMRGKNFTYSVCAFDNDELLDEKEIDDEDFGKEVFFSEEEAERILEERRNHLS